MRRRKEKQENTKIPLPPKPSPENFTQYCDYHQSEENPRHDMLNVWTCIQCRKTVTADHPPHEVCKEWQRVQLGNS